MTTKDIDDLRDIVRKLKPTGPDGFEGLNSRCNCSTISCVAEFKIRRTCELGEAQGVFRGAA